ncbi:hypothetical protein ACIRBX_25045 [Kitasatospora sp. NPDC096147]|uniref:hypothetical protein n=1 Tax=Kitasatospora sp. NPDC096147 TaxID=3364093 RepID=UPI00380F9F07
MMLLTVPDELPNDVLRVKDLRAQLEQMADDDLMVGFNLGVAQGRVQLGWPVKASVRNESGRRVPVVGLPQVQPTEPYALHVSLMRSRLLNLPDEAMVVVVWEATDGPRQTTVGAPVETTVVDESSGVTLRGVGLPQVVTGATGYAYDELVYSLGWE